jgi:hypothetical protein
MREGLAPFFLQKDKSAKEGKIEFDGFDYGGTDDFGTTQRL